MSQDKSVRCPSCGAYVGDANICWYCSFHIITEKEDD